MYRLEGRTLTLERGDESMYRLEGHTLTLERGGMNLCTDLKGVL